MKKRNTIKYFSEKDAEDINLNKNRHWRIQKRKEKFIKLVKSGYSFTEIRDELGVKDNTLIRYCLETNMIPSLSTDKTDFDRNLLYTCIKEYNTKQKQKKKSKRKNAKNRIEKSKFSWDPDWMVK